MKPEADNIEKAEDALDIAVMAVENAVMMVIAERLGGIAPGMTLAEALANTSQDMRRINAILRDGESDASDAADAVMASMQEVNEVWAAPFYEAAGATMGAAGVEALEKGRERVAKRIPELFKSSVLGLAVREGDKLRVKPIKEAYRAIVTGAAQSVAAGKSDPNKAVSRAVSQALGHMAEAGVRVMYDSGATRELYGAVRMNVMDTYRQTMQDARYAMGREFGADGVEVSAHGTCAPDHQPYQGRQFSNERFAKVQEDLRRGSGRPIAEGYNCRHLVTPIIMGVLKPANTEAELERMKAFSNEMVTFRGLDGQERTVTRYEATQYQRLLERHIRDANLKAALKDEAGVDSSADKARARAVRAVYNSMSKSSGLVTQPRRTRVHLPS